MDLSLTALSLFQGEIEFLSLEEVDDVGGENTFELSLVGRFLANRSFHQLQLYAGSFISSLETRKGCIHF